MAVDLSHFQQAFFDESDEHVQTIEMGLLELEQRPDDLDLLNRIFRAAHSIKGNSGMFDFTEIGSLTHKMENLLDALRNARMRATQDVIDLLLQALDRLKTVLAATRQGSTVDQDALRQMEEQLSACLEGGSSVSQEQTVPLSGRDASLMPRGMRHVTIEWTPLPELFQRGLDPAHVFQELRTLGEIRQLVLHQERLPTLAEMDPERCYLSWTIELESDQPLQAIEQVFEFVRDGSELTIAEQLPDNQQGGYRRLGELLVEQGATTPECVEAALAKQKPLGQILVEDRAVTPQQVDRALAIQQQTKRGENATIRVDTDKIDKLINLVGELVITQSMIADLSEKFTMSQLPTLLERLAQLERNTRELQERVMSIRMVPVGSAFQRFPRLVRDLAAKSGKHIQLLMSGEETELDKTVIEAIGDPLTHLVRNSADHGLETQEERRAAGKAAVGTIRLHAYHDGGSICIAVEDDGRGLNRGKILDKAIEKGLIADGDGLTDEEVWQLIFRPGFSTADQVTDISGRGVGMDVVKRNIEGLGGSIAIHSQEGKGTRMTLRLPLTLAIIDGMTVRVGREHYIIPLLAVTESIRPAPHEVQTVVGRGEVVNLRGEWVPLVRVYDLFKIEPEYRNPAEALLVIVDVEGRRFALFVDELVGQQQVVIKSLERNYRKVDGISGATILGDGHVALILDVPGLVKCAKAVTAAA
ncbi:MAG: chemotaxis protein CheA [Nitrospirae bacterium]|nr:MAG: chemotaxis protein CheA [Nitrospirota bacterium]